MIRPLFALPLALTAAPVLASSYSATLDAKPAARFVTRDIVWTCAGTTCQGATEESRPLVLCQSLAKRAGRVGSFAVNGRAFVAGELQQCNASAKGVSGKALAAQ